VKVLVTTNRGFEDACASEIKMLTGKESEIRPFGVLGRVMFEVKNLEEAAEFTYLTRTANRVVLFLKHFKAPRTKEGLEKIYGELKDMDWEFMNENITFAVRSKRMGVHEYNSMDIMRVAGQAIIDSIQERKKYRQKVNLDEPDVVIRVDAVGEDFFVGIDLVGEKGLHKRGYKVYNHPASLKPTIAQSLIILSEWCENKVLLDPMCGSGTIPIEAGLFARNIPGSFWRKKDLALTKLEIGIDWFEFFRNIDEKFIRDSDARIIASDKLVRHVKGAEINAQRALVKDLIQFRRIDLEWLDLKIGEKNVDYIITNPPYGVRMSYKEELQKIYKYLFYQAEYILNDQGKIVLVTTQKKLTLKYAEKYKFSLVHERKVWNGNLEAFVFIFTKE
jgi:tRNA (guanine6-N2)-methyltransferase